MNLKDNARIIEVRTAYALNRIYNYVNKKNFKEHLILLECLVESVNEENKDTFLELVKDSVEEKILGASKKEIYATMKAFGEKPGGIIKRLGISRAKYDSIYADLKNRDFINQKFIDSLEPKLDEKGKEICMLINNFIENFTYLTGDDYFEHYDHERTLELEFLMIYNKIVEILQNPNAVEKFLYKICSTLEIDWSTISSLLRSINFISRNNTNQIMGRQQLRLEVFNLFYLKGFNKNEIGKNIFNAKNGMFYTKGYEKSTKNITNDEWEFNLTYSATLDWEHLNKEEVLKFISLFKGFVNAGL